MIKLDSDTLIEEYIIEEYIPITTIDKKLSKLFWQLAKKEFKDVNKKYWYQLSVEAFHKGFDAKLPSDLLKDIFNDDGLLKDKDTYGKIKEAVDSHPNNYDYLALMSFWGMQFGKKSANTKIWKTEAERISGTEQVETEIKNFIDIYTKAASDMSDLLYKVATEAITKNDVVDLQKALTDCADTYTNQYKQYYDQIHNDNYNASDILNIPPEVKVHIYENGHTFDKNNSQAINYNDVNEALNKLISYSINFKFGPTSLPFYYTNFPINLSFETGDIKYKDLVGKSEQEIKADLRKDLLDYIKELTKNYIKTKDLMIKDIPDAEKEAKQKQLDRENEASYKAAVEKCEQIINSNNLANVAQSLLTAKKENKPIDEKAVEYIWAELVMQNKNIREEGEYWSRHRSDGDLEVSVMGLEEGIKNELAPLLRQFNWNYSVRGVEADDPFEIGDSTKSCKDKILAALYDSTGKDFKLKISY